MGLISRVSSRTYRNLTMIRPLLMSTAVRRLLVCSSRNKALNLTKASTTSRFNDKKLVELDTMSFAKYSTFKKEPTIQPTRNMNTSPESKKILTTENEALKFSLNRNFKTKQEEPLVPLDTAEEGM